MTMFRKFLSLAIILGITTTIIFWTFASFEFRSPIFAFLLNWIVMSCFAMMGQFVAFPAFRPGYYEIKPFERSGRFYEQLGVHFFKRMVRRGPLAIFSPTLRFPGQKTTSALRLLDNEMRKAETSHLAIFLVILLPVGYALFKGWLDAVGWLLLFNILFNGYPVMLQRYNRIKIQKLIMRAGNESQGQET